MTQDMDFADVRRFAPGSHHGLVLIRVKEPDLIHLRERIREVFGSEPVEEWAGCFVAVGSHKVRVIRPQ